MRQKYFAKSQNKRWYATKDQQKRDETKYGKGYVKPPLYPVKRYDGDGNLIGEVSVKELKG
jgi:hypothetical protein